MSEWKIERGLPIPEKSPAGRAKKYPWNDMQPGESVFFPSKQGVAGRKLFLSPPPTNGRTWTQRTLVEDGVTGVRVWRVT